MADITPGSTINVKIVKTPTNASARKTIVRILSKDAEVVAENKRHKKVRKTNQTHSPRGGRWRHGTKARCRGSRKAAWPRA